MKIKLLYILLLFPFVIYSQQVDLFQQFNGRLDFTAFGNTLNTSENPNACNILTESSADFNLSAGQTFVSAHLYWAGSGTGDFDVTLNGNNITAQRTFSLFFNGLDYFAAYADVTNIVDNNGQGNYTLSELDLRDVIGPYCGGGTNFGGWSVIVIYEDPSLLLNQISLFDGLEFVALANPTLEIVLNNINVATQDLAKIGFLAWEGDADIANNETLLINGVLIDNPPLNPGNNAFNGTNSYTNSTDLFNMDLDFYDIEDIVSPGDTSITINLTSSQDFVMVNNIITSVNSELPDASIAINNIGVFCEDSNIDITYTVYNINSTAPLPAGTPVAFYADNVLIAQSQTMTELAINTFENNTISLFIPAGTPSVFTLKIVVDDDGMGNSTVPETNESNNEAEIVIDLENETIDLGPDIQSCEGYTETLDADVGDPNFTYIWFYNGVLIPDANDTFYEVTQTGTYKVEAVHGICFVSGEIFVNFNPNPIAVIPDDMETCDEVPNDGLAIFDLTIRDAQIINGQPNTFVAYYELEADAISGTGAIATPTAFENTTLGYQVIYARLEESQFGCFDVVPMVLQVNQAPSITDPIEDYSICDNDQDNTEIFDLTTKNVEILNTLVNVTLTYHNSQSDAENSVPLTGDPLIYPSSGELIWVRAENSAGCVTIGSFNLVLGTVPLFTDINPLEQCDDELEDGITDFDLNDQNTTITNGDTNLTVSYHLSQADADIAANPITPPYTGTNGELIYVRIEDNTTGCYASFEMELVVIPPPTIFTPSPLEYCDTDNDGFGEFTLTEADQEVTGGVPTGNLEVSYHYLLEDAQNGILPLASPYPNIDPYLQTVYVRLYDISTGCYNITSLDLMVLDSPLVIDPEDLVACDDNTDGLSLFDLTQVVPELLNGVDPSTVTITYYEDVALSIAITTATSYANITNPQTIYVLVEDNNNGCQGTASFDLLVNLPPVLVAPSPLELCDATEITGPNDKLEPFDLESKTVEITNNNPNINITYHESQVDADAGINALTSPHVNRINGVTFNPQTIYIRAEEQNTNCIVSQGITLDLIVNPLPSPITPTPLEQCDVDNDGFAIFTLTDKDVEIIGGEPDVTISYYETESDAEAGIFALTSPYMNVFTPSQVIYARADYPLPTECFKIVELELIVNPTPVIPLDLDPIIICDDDGDGFSIFDLTQRAADIYGSQNPADYTLTYHTEAIDAQDGANAIANPGAFPNVTNPDTIWVRLEDTTTACIKVGTFELQVAIGPVVTQPVPYSLCDDLGELNDGITLFDLTQKDDEITGGVPGVVVAYYESQADAENEIDPINPATAYENTSNPQTIYIGVTDTNTGCYDATLTLTLRVAPNPDPEDPDPIALCETSDPADGIEEFDLTIREAQILDGETWGITYYNSYQDAVDDNAQLLTPAAYTNVTNPEIVYVRASIDITDSAACFEIVELEILVNPLPDNTVVIENYIICEISNDGFAIFDLTTKLDEILNGQDPAIFEVSFYTDQTSADTQINVIPSPEAYLNTSNPQTIYVGILNNQTSCYVSTQTFDLEVREGAVANAPLDPYTICDTWGDNDGEAEFDLRDQDLLDEIFGGQDPAIYHIDYFESYSNADLNISPLANGYINTINPQVIYVRVTNTQTDCYDIAEVILKVELLPIINIEEFYRLCVDAQGNPLPAEEGETSPPVIDTGLDPSIYIFEWYLNGNLLLGEIGSNLTALEGGIYKVVVTEVTTGCSSEAETTVTVSSPPLVYSAEVLSGAFAINEVIHTDSSGVTESYTGSHVIHVEAEGLGTYVYQLDDGPFQEGDVFVDVDPGLHVVTIKDVNGCGSVTIELSVVDYPQYMTPNQDGYHDTWNIIGIGEFDPSAKIYIFDRYGKLLKQLSPTGNGWDGTYNGNPLPSSDYWFRVEYTEDNTKKEFKGHFTLKR